MKFSQSINQGLILLFVMSLCGLLSILLGKELCWDLANYHLYNPFALLNNRTEIDYWPTSFIHSRLNPTVDLLGYFLIKHFSSFQIVFSLGAIHGINFWIVYQIALLYLTYENITKYKEWIAAGITLLAVLGPAALSGIGSFQEDDLISIFILGFFYLQTLALQTYAEREVLSKKLIIASSMILGMGVGLKLTGMVYVVGSFLTLFFLPIKFKEKCIWMSLFCVSVLFGFFILSGYWMWFLWKTYHNPVFPFFNAIFRSSQFPFENLKFTTYLPNTIWQTIFFPFYFSFQGTVGDDYFRDFRYLIVYMLFAFTAVKFLFAKNKSTSFILLWLYGFFIFSYIVWEYYFSIIRYLTALEMLTPLLIFLLLKNIIKKQYYFFSSVLIIFSFIAMTMHPLTMVRAPWYGPDYVNIKLPSYVSNTEKATVLMAYPAYALEINPRPQTYLIPWFPSHWQFVGIPFFKKKFALNDISEIEKIKKFISAKNEKIFLLTSESDMKNLYEGVAVKLNLTANGPCQKIYSDRQRISNEDVLICPVVKRSHA